MYYLIVTFVTNAQKKPLGVSGFSIFNPYLLRFGAGRDELGCAGRPAGR